MRKNKILFAAVFAAIMGSTFISCKNNLIPEPTINLSETKNPADYADAILPPKTVTATHGGYRNITLEWSPVENAVRYQIFYARTPFDSFEKLVETADSETTYDIEAPAGSTYYFYIKAVNYFETVSAESIKVTGSTLAIPIITNISASDDAQSVTIEWWMDNCTPETYQNELLFTIKAYDSQKKEIPGATTYKEGNCRSVGISGLEPNTEYFFTVQAEIKEVEQKAEISDQTSKETMHNIIPSSIHELTATQGISTEEIKVSWKLPDGVDYFDAFTKTYSIHPVMFLIQRKDLSKNDSDYKDIATVGTEGITSHPLKLSHTFNSETETGNSLIEGDNELTVDGSTAISYIDADNTYPKYKPGTTLTFIDKKNIDRGKQYSYRVISYTDDTIKEYKADSSISNPVNGWLLSAYDFKATAEYVTAENESMFSDVNVSFKFNFTPFSTPYHYILTQQILPFKTEKNKNPEPGEEIVIAVSDSVSSISGKKINFNVGNLPGDSWKGSYKFKLYITDMNSSGIPSDDNCFGKIESSGTIAVTNDKNSMPTINSFVVEDGFSDKFVLTWDFNESYSYSISWTPYIDGNPQTQEHLDLSLTDLKISDDKKTATFEHKAVSGDIRTYCLTAENGLPVSKYYTNNEEENIICETLGTAKPEMAAADYSTITVTWVPVQKATDYKFNAKYRNDPDKEYDDITASFGELLKEGSYTFDTDLTDGKLTLTIPNVKGHDNAKISGLPIDLEITAINKKSETKANKEIYNLGPALTFPETNKTCELDRMSFSWKKIDGTEKYLIYRVLYSDKSLTTISATDEYLITETKNDNGETIGATITAEQELEGRATIVYNAEKNLFTLTDIQKDATEVYGYHLTQEKIQWGLPFGYIVLPLKEDGSKSTFEFEENSISMKNSSAVNYGTLSPAVTHTYGYGMNIRAGKSVSASTVNVSWESPNSKDLTPTVYRKPFKKDEAPEYGSSWEFVATLSKGATSYSDKLTKDNISSAFVYCVQYEAPKASDIVKSYREQLLTAKDSVNSPEEPLNKGYLLTLKNFDAIYGGNGTVPGDSGYYQENVNWSNTWDYEERALGPDSFSIDMKNKNLSSTANWVTIANISISDETQSITPVTTHTDTTIDVMAANNGITLKPEGLTAKTATSTDGLLKVLRDAKHYYSANLTRGAITVRQAEDESVYAYRQISDEELCKCVSLIIADGLYQASIPESGISSWQDSECEGYGDSGKMQVGHEAWSNKVRWGTNNKDYIHQFVSGGNSLDKTPIVSDFIINCPLLERNAGAKEHTLYNLPETTITVKHNFADGYKMSSFEGELYYSVGITGKVIIGVGYPETEFTLTIKKSGNTVHSVTNNKTDFLKWFPYAIGTKADSKIISADSSLPLYQSPWWN